MRVAGKITAQWIMAASQRGAVTSEREVLGGFPTLDLTISEVKATPRVATISQWSISTAPKQIAVPLIQRSIRLPAAMLSIPLGVVGAA
jgi:hypothetical protein